VRTDLRCSQRGSCQMKRIGVAATAGLAVLFLTAPLVCRSGEGPTWHVTVKNPTQFSVAVLVGYSKDPIGNQILWAQPALGTVGPGGEYTWGIPGAYCPFGLSGQIYVPNGGRTDVFRLAHTSCLGHSTRAWTACCSNLTFEVCRKVGTGDTYQEEDFGFCRK
jgi:hypothetical protein